jgi:hypothetical protein
LWTTIVEIHGFHLDGRIADVAVPQGHVHLALWHVVTGFEMGGPRVRTKAGESTVQVMVDTVEWSSIPDLSYDGLVEVKPTDVVLSSALIRGLWMPAMGA